MKCGRRRLTGTVWKPDHANSSSTSTIPRFPLPPPKLRNHISWFDPIEQFPISGLISRNKKHILDCWNEFISFSGCLITAPLHWFVSGLTLIWSQRKKERKRWLTRIAANFGKNKPLHNSFKRKKEGNHWDRKTWDDVAPRDYRIRKANIMISPRKKPGSDFLW